MGQKVEGKALNGKKTPEGQNVEQIIMTKGQKVESDKRRMGYDIEREIMTNGNNVECKKNAQWDITSNGKQ